MNFCHYNEHYDHLRQRSRSGRRQSLGKHRRDQREHIYTRAELEAGATHDPYWNAAMREMRVTGYMHNYMRMYWGKKILEWSPTPEEALRDGARDLTTSISSTAATPMPSPTSAGSSACTIARGRSGKSSARCAT